MKAIRLISVIFLSIAIASCGGGNSTSTSSESTLSGVAAAGAAIASATITIKGANGVVVTTITDASGKYSATNVSSLTAPYLLKVTTTTGTDLYSVGNATGTVNIHPLTDLILSAWYQAHNTTIAAAFADPTAANNAPPTAKDVKLIKHVLESRVANWLVLAGIDPITFDLITTPFIADSTKFDSFLDSVKVVNNNTISVNTNGANTTSPEYQVKLTGTATDGGTYTGEIYSDLSNSGTFALFSSVAINTAASLFNGAYRLSYDSTITGTTGQAGNFTLTVVYGVITANVLGGVGGGVDLALTGTVSGSGAVAISSNSPCVLTLTGNATISPSGTPEMTGTLFEPITSTCNGTTGTWTAIQHP